jgi:hypothetical protein
MSGWKVNGVEQTQEEWDARPKRLGAMLESGRGPMLRSPECWPMRSDALGINPEQIPEQMAEDKRNGLDLEYDKVTGQCIIPGPSMHKKACIANGFFQKNAGYSEATPDDVKAAEDVLDMDDAEAEEDWSDP